MSSSSSHFLLEFLILLLASLLTSSVVLIEDARTWNWILIFWAVPLTILSIWVSVIWSRMTRKASLCLHMIGDSIGRLFWLASCTLTIHAWITIFLLLHYCNWIMTLLAIMSRSLRMEGMLWIEDIVKSTLALPFLINPRVDMVNFMDPYKMTARKSTFSSFPCAQNEGENKKLKKTMQKRRRRLKKSKVNLILSHVNHTFFILNSQIGLIIP